MPDYRILTNPKYPVFDPYQPLWRKVLGWLRLIQRPRMVIVRNQTMYCHPAAVPAIKELLDKQGFTYSVSPMLASVEGKK